MKNAGKACNNRLYRHIRTFEKIVKNYFVISTKFEIPNNKKWKLSFFTALANAPYELLIPYGQIASMIIDSMMF